MINLKNLLKFFFKKITIIKMNSFVKRFLITVVYMYTSLSVIQLTIAQKNNLNSVSIGAIFTDDQKDSQTELAFKYAVYRINKDRTLLPNTTLIYDIQYVPKEDSFHTNKKACFQLGGGVNAIFGPQDSMLGSHIQSLCDALDIPHIEARIDIETKLKEFSINLYPSPVILGNALKDLIRYLNWSKIAVIYEDDLSLIKLQQLVRPPWSKTTFTFRKSNPSSFREVLRDVRANGIFSFIIDTKPESLQHFITAVMQMNMNNYKYNYHFVTFDMETFDLDSFKYNFINMTAYRMVDIEHASVRQILRNMEKFQPMGQNILNKSNVINVEPALMYDSVYALALGLQSLERGATLRPVNVSCDDESPWNDGSSLFNYVNAAEFRGLTGKIQFKEGRRSTLKLDLLKYRYNKLDKIGEWSTTHGMNITKFDALHEFGTTNITLRVTTIESQPYVMRRTDQNYSNDQRSVSDQFEGFCIDLLQAISESLGFHYELYLVPDGKFGAENTTTGEWNGLVREIIEKNADLAVAPMTINYARESVIHFTKPYMNLGIGILFRVPSSSKKRLFSIMAPLDVTIWLSVMAALITVSVILFIVARFSPYEWKNPHPCDINSDLRKNPFSIANSFWFTIVTLMHQGCNINPKATSTRIIGAIWWFFTLILISSYTANLAAFLTVERMITPIESVEDLAVQSKISYGTLESGSTMTFFRDSNIETYEKMWRFMKNRPNVFVKNYEEGVERVLQTNYAFLMESTMLDYYVQRNCNLTQIGGFIDSKGYGIATPIGSPWRDKLSLTILDLQEEGVIRMLFDKWWKKKGNICKRSDKSKEGKANALGVDNIGEVFIVLLFGLAFAVCTACAEFCYHSRKNVNNSKQSMCSKMGEELRSAVHCRTTKKRQTMVRTQCSKCMALEMLTRKEKENGMTMQMIDSPIEVECGECGRFAHNRQYGQHRQCERDCHHNNSHHHQHYHSIPNPCHH